MAFEARWIDSARNAGGKWLWAGTAATGGGAPRRPVAAGAHGARVAPVAAGSAGAAAAPPAYRPRHPGGHRPAARGPSVRVGQRRSGAALPPPAPGPDAGGRIPARVGPARSRRPARHHGRPAAGRPARSGPRHYGLAITGIAGGVHRLCCGACDRKRASAAAGRRTGRADRRGRRPRGDRRGPGDLRVPALASRRAGTASSRCAGCPVAAAALPRTGLFDPGAGGAPCRHRPGPRRSVPVPPPRHPSGPAPAGAAGRSRRHRRRAGPRRRHARHAAAPAQPDPAHHFV